MNLCGKSIVSTSCLALVASLKSTCGGLSNTGLSQMSIWSHVAVERILCSKDAAGRMVSIAGARLHLRVGSRYLIRSEKGVSKNARDNKERTLLWHAVPSLEFWTQGMKHGTRLIVRRMVSIINGLKTKMQSTCTIYFLLLVLLLLL